MPSPARVLLAVGAAEADRQAAASLAAGWQREGVPASEVGDEGDLVAEVRGDDLVIVSTTLEDPVAAVRGVRSKHGEAPTPEHGRPPIIAIGDAARRDALLAAGANAFMAKPAYVKDVVTLGRILCMPREGLTPGWGGDLESLHLYHIVRALGAAKKTGVLGLHRGGRRGELRFLEGEVTSAQVGALHGQAALHQLLLWPDATFDLRAESVVRRQQIPLTPAELLADAERFLRDFHELSGGASPASLYEQDLVKASENVDRIPKEVQPVVRLFDGARTVADVIEESPLRFAETLKIMGRLVALGVLKKIPAPRAQRDSAAALLVEDWLVGQTPPAGGERPRRRPKGETPKQGAPAADWGSLGVAVSWESPGYAPVVPSLTAKGEISVVAARTAIGSTPAAPVGAEEGTEPNIVAKNGRGQGGPRTGTSTGPALAVAMKPAPELEPEVAEPAPPPPPKTKNKKTGELRIAGPPPAEERHFADHEEAFFNQEQEFSAHEAGPVESFADLDAGRPKLTFWQRLFKKKPAKKKKRKP